jgi:hypothetical protein
MHGCVGFLEAAILFRAGQPERLGYHFLERTIRVS